MGVFSPSEPKTIGCDIHLHQQQPYNLDSSSDQAVGAFPDLNQETGDGESRATAEETEEETVGDEPVGGGSCDVEWELAAAADTTTLPAEEGR